MEADYAYQDLQMERYYWSLAVNAYTKKFDIPQLLLEAREVLSEEKERVPKDEFMKIRSILTKGIIYQSLTDKQRYALGNFILGYS